MPRKDVIKHVKRIVVKVGTTTVTKDGKIDRKKIRKLVSDVSHLISHGYEVAIVSSGAITSGIGEIGLNKKTLTIPERQALAAVGQTILLNEYKKAFAKFDLLIGQILLTEDDICHRRRFLNAKNTLESLLKMNIIPIINENDSVVVKEIKFGDNDTLSAHVSALINADLLILLSDVDGFYWNLSDDKPIEEIKKINDDVRKKANGSNSTYGTGGMTTKIAAAEVILRFGEMMIIANGNDNKILRKIMNGENIGTIFYNTDKPISGRRKWVAQRKIRGQISLDNGAVKAILDKKKSLLAVGITSIDKKFDMGDSVEFLDKNGNSIGKGIVNYNSLELEKIIGKKNIEIKKILGSKYYDEVINRDDLILF